MGDDVEAAGNGGRGLTEKLLVRCSMCGRLDSREHTRVLAPVENIRGGAADLGGAGREELLATCGRCGRGCPCRAAAAAGAEGSTGTGE